VSASKGDSDAGRGDGALQASVGTNLAAGGLGLLLWQHQRRTRTRRSALGRPRGSPPLAPTPVLEGGGAGEG